MCGFAGYVDLSGRAISERVLRDMAQSLRRRGPDDSGALIDGPCGLAHARLSIIDLAGSPQPMRTPDGPHAIAYNGEVYNYQRLRADLAARGERLTTEGDTEAILRWCAAEWERAPTRLSGIFGFAVWDSARRRLLLARDPLGVKPLFVARPRPDLIVFGSEIKALLTHPEVAPELDEAGLRQALRFRSVYGERTMYRGVTHLRPGSWLEFSASGERTGVFYDLIARADALRGELARLGEQELIARGEALFTDAVRSQLVADVPVGAFLSGGLDSSLLVAAMREIRGPGADLLTFSVGFEGDANSELPHARVVADAVGSTHTEVPLTQAEYIASFAEMTACRDAPVSEPADLAVARMSVVAKREVKVVLSGEGADEVFAGYPKYAFASAPGLLRRGVRALGPRRAAALARALGVDARRVSVAVRALALPDEVDRHAQWFSYLERARLAALFPGLGWGDADWLETTRTHREALARVRGAGALERMQTLDCLTWLPGNMLERGDRMTMAAGLEMRVPFLDQDLAPWGLALPDRMKVRGANPARRTLKWIMRRWADRRLPPGIVGRKKWGFRVPLDQWFRGAMRPMMHEYLTASDSLIARFGGVGAARALLADHDAGRGDAGLELWTLLAAEVWWRDVFAAQRSAHASSSDRAPAVLTAARTA